MALCKKSKLNRVFMSFNNVKLFSIDERNKHYYSFYTIVYILLVAIVNRKYFKCIKKNLSTLMSDLFSLILYDLTNLSKPNIIFSMSQCLIDHCLSVTNLQSKPHI